MVSNSGMDKLKKLYIKKDHLQKVVIQYVLEGPFSKCIAN